MRLRSGSLRSRWRFPIAAAVAADEPVNHFSHTSRRPVGGLFSDVQYALPVTGASQRLQSL